MTIPSIVVFIESLVSLSVFVPVSNVGFAGLPVGGTQYVPSIVPTLSVSNLLLTTLA